MNRRIKMLFFLVCGLSLLVTACSSTKKQETGQQQEKNPVTLRTVTMYGGADPNAAVYEHIREEFQKEYDYISIQDESRTADEAWKSSVAADFSAGNEPDVLQFFTDATANQLVATDKFVTIDEIREVYPEYAKDTFKDALEQSANLDGVERAVPTTGYWEGLYCNKDLFEQYDIPLPKSWSSFVKAVQVFKENGITPVACSLTNVPHYWMEYLLLYSSGKEAYEKTYTEVPEDWVKGLEMFQTLRDMGTFPENTDTVNNDYATHLFQTKQAAMILEGNWYLAGVEDQENTVVIQFPGIQGQKAAIGTVVGGMSTGFYITRRAWNDPDKRDAAVKYVMAHTCKAAVQQYWDSGGAVAAAATEVTLPSDLTPLEKSARVFVENSREMVLSTDARMDPQAYKQLVSGVLEISEGSSAQDVLKNVLGMNQERQEVLYKK